MIKYLVGVCLVLLFYPIQVCCQAKDLDMKPDAFDDQYIGCEEEMEKEMPKILAEERKYQQFDTMWKEATKKWRAKQLKLPASFKDEYGIAVVLYTMERPYRIYEQLNNNVSIAGKSRNYYMNNFHFKALHFYLTRALQVLRKGCAQRFTTYRGSKQVNINVSPDLRFGQFASSSRNREHAAKEFGTATFFIITTCFGAYIADFSDFKAEEEVLIPVSEEFRIIKTTKNNHTLESTGKLCSNFNCAYLGGEKKPVCSSGTFLYSGSSARLFLVGLIMNIVISHLY